ncbi:hypothetical protein [Paracoccus shanxieyensis]|uniref:hypothetical protein n=2 Tax=Paracoccus shanxieyensis TaxID=2675752 RepID=UPI0031346287
MMSNPTVHAEVKNVTDSGKGQQGPDGKKGRGNPSENSGKAEIRAQRKLANEAERAQRKQDRVAEREARGNARNAGRKKAPAPAFMEPPAEAAEASPAPIAAPAAPVSKPAARSAVPFNILIVAQQGRLAAEAVLFAASLRRNAPDWKGRLIVAEPREAEAWQGTRTQLDDHSRALLTGYGAEVLPFTAQHFGRAYPYGNKIEALALLPPGQPFVFFDSDTLITGPLDQVGFDFNRPSASMRRSGSWPQPPLYGPGYTQIWRSLYDRFGLDFDSSLDAGQHDEHWERYLYFNAGWFFGADPAEFGRRFLDWSLAVRNDPGDALACQSLDPWLDQIVLPLVIHSLGGGRPGPELNGLDGAASCHYRNLSLLYARESDAAVALVEDLLRDPQIAPLFAADKAAQQLVTGGEGRSKVRPMFSDAANQSEQPIRQKLKREGFWFR